MMKACALRFKLPRYEVLFLTNQLVITGSSDQEKRPSLKMGVFKLPIPKSVTLNPILQLYPSKFYQKGLSSKQLATDLGDYTGKIISEGLVSAVL